MTTFLQDIPEIGLTFTHSPIVDSALAHTKEHCSPSIYNHAVRAAYWATIIAKKGESLSSSSLDLEILLLSCILHDMGWSETAPLISEDKRFEVDGANIARDFLLKNKQQYRAENGDVWGENRIQRCWDAIALHTTPSIAAHAAPEVALTNMGVAADFMGPAFPNGPGKDNVITIEEYRAVMVLFPRLDFTATGLKQVMCGLCRRKPVTTYDNFVGIFGLKFGIDGKGAGKEDFERDWEENQAVNFLVSGLNSLQQLDTQL
ncbi:metal dependent phosphohydrolase [Pochonia chlamydosporia 170]|uniref:Metal dependent phosphohydrolase n=1 Tax=Pochonia chlamydosporia 170 TaxID=1380566 RepID=A0A179FYG7_METCM|nr:metal dependent phosphohydrolase [Pochonia chlamydosporia 170]OAQ70684.1 metal dependent phosphohydrolase [Pochonia chlamydosporia 170]